MAKGYVMGNSSKNVTGFFDFALRATLRMTLKKAPPAQVRGDNTEKTDIPAFAGKTKKNCHSGGLWLIESIKIYSMDPIVFDSRVTLLNFGIIP